MNVDGFDKCVSECLVNFVYGELEGDPEYLDSFFVRAIGLEYKPNIPFVIPDGKWRKKTKSKPNCTCLKKAINRRGNSLDEVTGSTGLNMKKNAPSKPSYTQCFKRISAPDNADDYEAYVP